MWFKEDDSKIDRLLKFVDILIKTIAVLAVIVAVWKFCLFQEATEIINTSIEHKTLTDGKKSCLEVSLKVVNTGKVRVYLKSGLLRIKPVASATDLSFRLSESHKFDKEVVIPNVFSIAPDKFEYTMESKDNSQHNNYLEVSELFFDPGETIKMRFLVEYSGGGICNIISRYDGVQNGSVWFEETYAVLEQ